jgi:hypothetical protein
LLFTKKLTNKIRGSQFLLSRFWVFLGEGRPKTHKQIPKKILALELEMGGYQGQTGRGPSLSLFWPLTCPRGTQKNDGPQLSWFLGGQKIPVFWGGEYCFAVFELPLPRNIQKREKKSRKKRHFYFLGSIFWLKNST